MPELNLERLKQYRDEILKAEIVSFFPLLEKTYAKWWKEPKHGGFFGGQATGSGNIEDDIKSNLQNLLNLFLYPCKR